MADPYRPTTSPPPRLSTPVANMGCLDSSNSPPSTQQPSAISERTSSRVTPPPPPPAAHVVDDAVDDAEGMIGSRPLTTISSSATLCHWSSDDEDGSFGRHKTKDSIDHPATIAEAPAPPAAAPAAVPQLPYQQGTSNNVTGVPARKPSTRNRDKDDVPPPIHGPDIIAFLDPASSGGGGPLKRITTQQRERAEAEARERADRAHREALGVPEPEGLVSGGILGRLRSGSNARRRRPSGTALSDHPEEERFRPSLPTSWSTNTLTPSAIDDGDEKDRLGQPNSKTPSLLQVEEQTVEYVYPDGGYGWVVVVCCMTLCGCTLGQGMNYGAYQTYYMNVAFPGANTSYVSLVGTMNALFVNLVAFFFGRMGDRFGYKRIMYLGIVLFWLANFIASWCSTLWLLLLFQGVLSGLGSGMAVPLFMSLPSQWFYKRRGLASGLALSGAGLGGGTSLLIIRELLATVGYHKTLMIMSFVNLFFGLLAVTFVKTRPTSPEASGGGRGPWVDMSVVKSGGFWSIAISLIVSTLGYGTAWSYTQQWCLKTIPGIDPTLAVLPATLLCYSLTFGRGLTGSISDFLGPLNTFILCFALSGVIQLTLWLTAKTFAQICVFAVIYGLVAPGFVGLIPQMVVQLFGPSNLASNVGLLILFNGPGNMAGPPMAGALYDANGRTSFQSMIILGACLQFAGAIIALWARYKASPKVLIKI